MVVHTFAAIYIGTYDVSLKVFEFMDKKKFHQVDHIRARLDSGVFAHGISCEGGQQFRAPVYQLQICSRAGSFRKNDTNERCGG